MRRREFIRLASGAVIAWPLAARAQQSERIRRIGVLMSLTPDDPDGRARSDAFLQGLQRSGWIDGRNIRIDHRWGGGDADNFRKYAAELVALGPGTVTVAPLLHATRKVPIVFVQVADPVGAGFVDSLARPGGNATGFALFEYGISGKWLELLKEAAPRVTRAAVIRDPDISSGTGQFGALQSVAPSLGMELSPINLRDAGYVDRILRGEKPADLPVQAPTKYELVINMKTAKALGLTVPDTLLARADEVIE